MSLACCCCAQGAAPRSGARPCSFLPPLPPWNHVRLIHQAICLLRWRPPAYGPSQTQGLHRCHFGTLPVESGPHTTHISAGDAAMMSYPMMLWRVRLLNVRVA